MFYRNLSLLTVFVFGLFLISFVSSALIGDCRDVNSDIFGVTNTLTRDINGWVGTCFPLTEAGDNNYFELDCDRYSIDANSDSNILFDTVALNIDTIIFRNCDMNLFGSNVYGFRVDSDVNYLTVSDSNVDANSGSFFYSLDFADNTIDLNFRGSNFNISNLGLGFWAGGTSSYNSLIVRNLDLTNSSSNIFYLQGDTDSISILDSDITSSGGQDFDVEITSSTLDLNFSGTDYSFSGTGLFFTTANLSDVVVSDLNAVSTGGTFLQITDADLNNITVLDSNLDLDGTSKFFNLNSIITEDFLSFDLNNVDINYLRIDEDVPLDITAFSSSDSFIQINSGSDINLIEIRTTDSSQTAGNYILVNEVSDPELTIDFGDSDFNFSNTRLLYFLNSDINSITVTDVNAVSTGSSQILNGSYSDINFINLSSSTIDANDGYIVALSSVTDSSLEINLSNNVWNIVDDAGWMYLNANIGTLSINGLDINLFENNVNIITILTSDLNNINLLNSSIIGSTDAFGGSSFIAFNSVTDSLLDLNFSGSDINLPNNLYFFNFAGSNISDLTITDLNLIDFKSATSFIFTNATSDLNTVAISNSNLVLNDQVFFDDAINVSDDFLNFDFNNTDVNYLSFTDLNLNLTSLGAGEYFISATNNSDLNYIAFTGANTIDLNSTNLFLIDSTADDYLNFDFTNSTVDVEDGVMIFSFTDSNISTFETSDLNVSASPNYYYYNISNSDLNSVLLLDSNVNVSGDAYFANLLSTTDSETDWNFSGTVIDINVNATGAGFYFSSSNYDSFSIYDLTSLTYTDSGSALFKVLGTSDVNTFTFFGSAFDISSSSTFYDAAPTTQDTYLSFDFNNTDVNYLKFSDLNLNLTGFSVGDSLLRFTNTSDVNFVEFSNTSATQDSGTSFVQFDTITDDSVDLNFSDANVDLSMVYLLYTSDANVGTVTVTDLNYTGTFSASLFYISETDVNVLNFFDSTVNDNSGRFIVFKNNDDSEVDLNFSGTVLDLSSNSGSFIDFEDTNQGTVNVYDADLTSSGLIAFYILDNVSGGGPFPPESVPTTDVNIINIFDSNFVFDGNWFIYSEDITDVELDVNFSGSDINLTSASGFYFDDSNYTTEFNIYSLTATQTDENFFIFANSLIAGLNILDSNISLDNFADVNSDANVQSGTISNNKFWDSNTSNTFIFAEDRRFNADFNSVLEEDYNKRILWLSADDTNNVGGNLWVDSTGDNLCGVDIVAPFGICDSAYNISGSDINYSDNLPLRDYTPQDLNVTNIDFNAEPIIYGESVDINATIYNNSSSGSTDINYFVEYYIDGILDANYELDDVLASGASLVNTHIWDSNIAGDVNVYVCVNYQLDTNTLNDCNQTTLSVRIADLNVVVDVDDADANVNYGDDVNIQVTYGNEGDANAAANYTLTYYINNTQYASYTIFEDLNAGDIDTNSLLWDSNIVGDVNIYVVINYSGDDNDATNDYNYQSLWVRVVDLNAFDIDYNDDSIVLGDVVDINVDYTNSGDANANANYNVLYYIDDVLDANYIITEDLNASAIDTNNYVWTSDITGDVNVYVCLDYIEYDNNSINDCTQQTLTVTAASEPPSGGGKLKCSVSPTLTVSGDVSDNEKTSVAVKLNKSGGKDLDDGKMVLYLITDSEDKEIWSKTVAEEDLDSGKYSETLQYGVSELEKIDSDIFNLVDDSGNANFKLVISGCGEENSEKTSSAKIEYFKSKIKEVYFLDGSKKISVELNDTVNLDVDKTYTLYLVLNTKTINKGKNIDLEMINETEDKTATYWSDTLSWHDPIKESDSTYSEKINILNLMPHSKAKNFVFDILDLNKQDSEDKKKVDEIVKKLSDDFQSSEADALNDYPLDFDYISFGSATENIILKYFEGDIVKDSFSFAIEFEHESEKDPENPGQNNQGNTEGNSGEVSSSASGEDGEYFVNYKKKLGLGETQEFTILNSEKSPIGNLNMIVYFEDKNWQFKTDAKGKVLFTPEFEGEYSFGVPYPEEKVKGQFEVIEGYISSDSDFVEESGGFFSGWSDTAKKSFLVVIIVVAAVLVFVLYRLLRPKKKYGLESLSEKI